MSATTVRRDAAWRRTAWGLLSALVATASSACLEPLPEATVFEDQRYLCDPAQDAAWALLLDECLALRQAGAPCGGVMSMRGRLQGVDLVVETLLEATTHYVVEMDGLPMLNRLYLRGSSRYFYFVLKTYTLGGAVDASWAGERLLGWDPQAYASTASRASLEDTRVGADFRIETAIENVELPVVRDSGQLLLTEQGPDEVVGRFEASFGDADSLVEGCFHGLTTERRVETL